MQRRSFFLLALAPLVAPFWPRPRLAIEMCGRCGRPVRDHRRVDVDAIVRENAKQLAETIDRRLVDDLYGELYMRS